MKSRVSKARIVAVVVALVLAVLLVIQRKMRWPLLTMMAAAPTTSPAVAQASASHGPTLVEVSQTILREDVIRLGMNLGGESYYDSQQILKNLVSQNPGFEGRQWQSVLRCGSVTANSCTDGANNGGWPEGFLDGGTFEVIAGAASGRTGAILHSTAASEHTGATIQLAPGGKALAADDYIVVRNVTQGHPADGWSPYLGGGATVSAEYKDLSPKTPGRQALRISASQPGQYVGLATFFDTAAGPSYVQLRGPYVIRFRAKGIGGSKAIDVKLARTTRDGDITVFDRNVPLSGNWQDYSLYFTAMEPTSIVGNVSLSFSVGGCDVLLDDVSLEEAAPNGTAFRNDVVSTLLRLKPGVLRYMDSGQNFGSSLDDMIAPDMARRRSGFNRYGTEPNSLSVGLQDFLILCEKLHTQPWYTMQLGMSTQEASNIMEYLGGPATTKYGAIRAAQGHPVPWTETFPLMHLEYGNESWNTAQPGASMDDPAPYASRATTIFQTMRSSPYYPSGHFDLVADGQAVWAGRTEQLLKTMQGADTIDIAPYTFNTFADESSIEHIFGPMFAEPQFLVDTTDGYIHQQGHAAATGVHPVKLAVYEENIGTTDGTASQASINATVPSVGAGIATIENELLMLRDLGITVQNTFSLGGSSYHFNNTAGTDKNETSPIWATVIDMGGATNRVRPSFLAQQLANQAIRPTMVATKIEGDDPTWDQPKSANDKVQLERAHELQSFAFSDAASSTLIVINLSRTSAHSIQLSGPCSPQGEVTIQTLTSKNITDSNDLQETVKTVTRKEENVSSSSVFSLPPFSMSSFISANHGCVPARL